jgi:hypothetical protein
MLFVSHVWTLEIIFLAQAELNGNVDTRLEVLNLNNIFSPSSIATAPGVGVSTTYNPA